MNKQTDLELELTNICNAKCPLCYRNNKHYKQQPKYIRPLQEIILQLETFPNLEYIKLVGTISEPTLYPEFLELVDYINTRDIEIEICTNGDTRDNNFWRTLGTKLKEKDKIYFTICGSTQELHEIYRAGTSLENILKNVKEMNLGSEYQNSYAQLIEFNYNSEDFKIGKTRGSKNWIYILDHFHHEYWTETLLALDQDQYKTMPVETYKKLLPKPDKLKKYLQIKEFAKNIKTGTLECQAKIQDTCQIDLDGNKYSCYLFTECHSFSKKHSSIEPLNPKLLPEYQEKFQYDCCKYCEKRIRFIIKENNLDYII